MELERVVRILRIYGHPEAEAVDIARRILARPIIEVVEHHVAA